MSRELPISLASARKATNWLMTNFGGSIRAATEGTPFTPALVCGIACQETAYFWLPLVTKPGSTVTPDEIIARCVLDASGDAPGAPRSAFPKNTAAFYAKYDRAFGNMLVAEANLSRALRGFGPKQWIYKGYGIFQYDLQFVVEDEDYFRLRQWHDFEVCLRRLMGELKKAYKASGGDLWDAVRRYNGGGQAARDYRDNVKEYFPEAQKEIDSMSGGGTSRSKAARSTRSAAPSRGIKSAKPARGGVLLRTAKGTTTRSAAPARKSVRATSRGGELPASRPRITQAELAAKLAPFAIDRAKNPLIIVGIRGYYKDTMGAPGVNDRGMYDDALFIDAQDCFAAFNGNTDPSRFRPGEGFDDDTKGIAVLDTGKWEVHRFDLHKGEYLALCQRAGKVTVTRDGKKENYKDTGEFGINIHKGSYHGTSSLGCQTLHPDQWESFIATATDLARRYHGTKWKQTTIPYVLMDA